MSDTKPVMPFILKKQKREEPVDPFVMKPSTSEQQNPSAPPSAIKTGGDVHINSAQVDNLGTCAVSPSPSTQPMTVAQPDPDVGTAAKIKVKKISGDPRDSSSPSMLPPALRPDCAPQMPFYAPIQQPQQYPYTYQQPVLSAVPQPAQTAVIDKGSSDTSYVEKSQCFG